MKNTAFEAQIKSSLEHLEADYEPASWDLLRQKMDRILVEEEPAPVSEVDKAVFHKLQHVEMPYEPATWDVLAARMTQANRLRRRIWIGKIAEAAIFLLLLANLDGLLQMGDQDHSRPKNRSNSNRPQVDVPSKNPRQRQYASATGSQNGNAAQFDEAGNLLYTENGLPEFASLPGDPSGYENPDFPVQQLPAGNDASDEVNWHALASFVALDMRDARVAPSAGVFRTPYFPIKPSRSSKLYAATFTTYNRNFIKTGSDSRAANGYGGGIAVGYRNGKWAVEAGLAYNQANYSPKKEIEIYAGNLQEGYVGTYASQIDADVFSVPVKVTRRFAQMGRTSVHAVAGVTANVSVQKSYQYRTVSYGTGPSSQPNQVQPHLQPQLTRKGTGLLEQNGKLAGNFYATADTGIRIQQPIGKRFAAFVEPVYHQSLGNSGIGPKSNKINTFSVNAGVVASL
ncbi:MAG TPA: hypothetical protein PLO67_11350 [Saprospiraceae bacterium]|nr:hypothetical protein [Saprospiraceae bacterium]HPI06391.1 hypothetical protein [Saprospiraceae bacterium]